VHVPLVNFFLLLHPHDDVTHVLPEAPAHITPRRESFFSQFIASLNTSRTTYKIRDVVHDAHIAKQIVVSDSNHEAITATSSIRVIACNDATTLRAFASDVKILKSSSPTYSKKQIVVSGNAQVDLFSRFTLRYRDFANAHVTSKDALEDIFSELRFFVPELPDHIGRMDSLRDQISGPPTFPFPDATIKKHFLQAMAPEAVPLLTRILISGVRTTNVSDPALQEALLEIDPEFNLSHIINNSLQEAPFNILLTAATFTNPSLTQTFLTKCLTRAKAEDSDDPDRIHFYLDPCGLSGSLNHIPAYVSFKIDACSRASNGGAFEPFQSKVSLPCFSNPLTDQVFNANHDSHKNTFHAYIHFPLISLLTSLLQLVAVSFDPIDLLQASRLTAVCLHSFASNLISEVNQFFAAFMVSMSHQILACNLICAFSLERSMPSFSSALTCCLPSCVQDVPQAKLALIDTLELLDIDPNILDMTETKKFKDNPKNFAIFKLPTLEAAGRLLNCPPVRTHTAVPFDGAQATISPLALTRVIVEKQAQPVALSLSVGLPGEILPHTISILASTKHSAVFEKYCSPENLSGWLVNTLNFLPNVFTETSLPPTVKALLERFSEPKFLYALGNNHKPYPGIIVTLAPELASFLVANGLYYLEGRD
jgi:hypothetical protein